MNKFFNKTIMIDLLFIFILSLTPLLWFRGDSIMVGHDNVFPLDPVIFLKGRLFAWIAHEFGQSQALIMGTIPIHFIDAVPSILGFPVQLTQKIVYVFWFFMMGWSAYTLASVINKESRIFKLTGTMLYQFNFFILQGWFIGERTKFSAYIAFPLVLAIFLKVYRGDLKILKAVIYASLVFFLFNGGGLYGISLHGGFFIGILTFILFFSGLSFLRKEYFKVKKLLLFIICSSVGFLLVNAYYILPAISKVSSQYIQGVERGGGISGFINWASEISANASYINLLRLQGIAEWYDNPEHPFSKYFFNNPLLIIISFLWPFLIILTLHLYRKKEKLELVLYFFFCYLLGIFFTAGTHPPLGIIYEELMRVIPGSVAFRSPYFKFAPAVFLAFSFLIAFFVDYFSGRTKKIIFFLIFVLILAYHFPYFTGNFFEWRKGFSTRNEIPKYVFEFGKWMEHEKLEGRMLLLPESNPDWQYDMYKWGYLSFQALPTLVTNKNILINNDKLNGNDNETQLIFMIYDALRSKDAILVKKLASLLRVKYFLLRKDISYNLDWSPADDPSVYENLLENKFGFPLVKTFGEWKVYRIIDFQNNMPKIYTTSNLDNFAGEVDNLNYYLSFSNEINDFYINGDKNLTKTLKDSSLIFQNFYTPECLSCNYLFSPEIKFPQRIILPNSPLYPFVLLNDKLKIAKSDSKKRFYDYLGLTTKRISEIREMVYKHKNITEVVLKEYDDELIRLYENFQQISDFADKYQAARDVNIYLDEESAILRDLLGYDIGNDIKVNKFNKFFKRIKSINELIKPYLYKLNPLTERLYYLNTSDIYNVFVITDGFENFEDDKTELNFGIDKKNVNKQIITPSFKNNQLFLLGKINFSQNNHTMFLNFSKELSNLAEEFQTDDMDISTKKDIECFTSKIKNYSNQKQYEFRFNVPEDLKKKLYFYLKTSKSQQQKIENIIKVGIWIPHDIYKDIIPIHESNDMDGVFLGFCAEGISKSDLAKKLDLHVNEIVNPMLILKSDTQRERKQRERVSFVEINPTKYIINVDVKSSEVLLFMERFDESWELSGFNRNHFKAMGYANGWILDKQGKYELVLEYKPQKAFYVGSLISVFAILSSIIVLIVIKIKKHL